MAIPSKLKGATVEMDTQLLSIPLIADDGDNRHQDVNSRRKK